MTTQPIVRSGLRLNTIGAVAAALSTCVVLTLASPTYAATREAVATGPNGKTATRDISRQKGAVSSSTTGPNGKTASRNVDRSATSTTATMSGPNGKTANRSTNRTSNGSQTTVTGPNGQSGSASVTR
jgi:hypothetical protein